MALYVVAAVATVCALALTVRLRKRRRRESELQSLLHRDATWSAVSLTMAASGDPEPGDGEEWQVNPIAQQARQSVWEQNPVIEIENED